MVHITTGNRLDVVYTYEDDRKVLKGLQPWGGEVIALPDPEGLISVLQRFLIELKENNNGNPKEN